MEASRRGRAFPSARLMEAQRMFQTVVKQELQELLTRGSKREVAVKLLLTRIVASTEAPDAAAVRGVMRQFDMNYDDAVRALIVKQELGRLKKQGMDSLAAIEELTRKMRNREENDAKEVKQEEEQEPKEVKQMPKEAKQELKQTPTKEASLSLIQRIGQVSISSGATPEKTTEIKKESKLQEFSSPARIRSPTSELADLTPQTRKRRAAFGVQLETSGSRSNGRGVQPLFPSLKKQKLCAEVGDAFLQVVTRKSKPVSLDLGKNTAATGTSSGGSNNTVRGEIGSKNSHKRQRASPAGMQDDEDSPLSEELRVAHVHHRHHHTKRHKNSSTH